MKKRIMLSGILFILIIISVLVCFNKRERDSENVLQNKKYNETISMMLETASGSGEYEKTTASEWPTEGYVFNTELRIISKNDEQIEEQFEDTIEEDDLDDLEGPTDEDIMNVENGVEGDED